MDTGPFLIPNISAIKELQQICRNTPDFRDRGIFVAEFNGEKVHTNLEHEKPSCIHIK